MAKGFVNLNRFKHGRAMKRSSKQKGVIRKDKAATGNRMSFRGRER